MVEKNTFITQHTTHTITVSDNNPDDESELEKKSKIFASFFSHMRRSQTIFFCDKTT
jgi:hypothetical protein